MEPDGRIREISKTIEWSIVDFFTLGKRKRCFTSPEFFVENFQGSWFLEFYPRWKDQGTEFISIYLNRVVALECEVECSFYLKKSDCSVIHLSNEILGKGKRYNHSNDLIKKTELLQKKSELVPGNTLTVICTIQLETGIVCAIQNPVLKGTTPSKFSRLDKLSTDLKNLFDDKESSDVTLKVQDKEYKADKSVLIARSNVFAATFKHDTLERQTGVITILDCDSDSFQDFLKYLYSGELLEELSFRTALNLYYTANKYDVEELKEFCIDCLKCSLTVGTISETAVFAEKYDETPLLSEVQEFFNKNYIKIFLTPEWKYLLKNNFQLADKLLTDMAKSKQEE